MKITSKNLAQTLLELSDGKSEDETKKTVRQFVEYLAKEQMLSDADKILDEYRTLYNEKHGIVEATVTLVNRLPARTRMHLRETLKKKYKAREVHMLEKVDERILGGMKIKVGDTVYDSTLKNSLNQLQARLLK